MKNYLRVFGHTAVDIILQTDSLPKPNSSTAVKERTKRWGGTGANIAKAAADLNVKTGLSSFVGEDFPEEYEMSLVESGVDIDELVKLKHGRTPTCWIVTEPSGDQMALMDQGAMDMVREREANRECIENSEVIHIGTGRPEYYRKIMNIAKGEGKTVAFDPAQELRYVYEPQLFSEMLDMADIFFCNETEAELAVEYLRIENIQGLLDLVDTVIVTKGSRGSTIYNHKTKENVPAFEPKEIVDPTGAGDSYRAGFYAGRNRGYDLFESCLIGSARASFALESHGPQEGKVDWNSVLKRLEMSGHGIIN
ncbi:MAG: carbohydrate kinase family protein [Candidatus Saliniplasma sp.]